MMTILSTLLAPHGGWLSQPRKHLIQSQPMRPNELRFWHEHETCMNYRLPFSCLKHGRKASTLPSSSSFDATSKRTVSLPEMFDFDCNLTHKDLRNDLADIIEQSRQQNITKMLVPGSTIDESFEIVNLCSQYPNIVYPTMGVHPYNAHLPPTSEQLEQLRQGAALPQVVAIGECGLDYSPGFPPPDAQSAWFLPQLRLACELNKPLFLHERLAHGPFIQALRECQIQYGAKFPDAIVHCFTGTPSELKTYCDMGFYIGITGYICKKNQQSLQTGNESLLQALSTIPLNRLVVETDAPYMGFPKCRTGHIHPKKQYPNVPTALPLILKTIAPSFNLSTSELAKITTQNAKRFLRLL